MHSISSLLAIVGFVVLIISIIERITTRIQNNDDSTIHLLLTRKTMNDSNSRILTTPTMNMVSIHSHDKQQQQQEAPLSSSMLAITTTSPTSSSEIEKAELAETIMSSSSSSLSSLSTSSTKAGFDLVALRKKRESNSNVSNNDVDVSVFSTSNGILDNSIPNNNIAIPSSNSITSTTIVNVAESNSNGNSNGNSNSNSIRNGFELLRLNSGASERYIDWQTKTVWSPDEYCTMGLTHNICSQVPDISKLYCQGRNGFKIEYDIPDLIVGNTCNVTLHFMETYWKESGKRMANIYLDGKLVGSALDYYDEFGYRTPGSISTMVKLRSKTLKIMINNFEHRTIFNTISRILLFIMQQSKLGTATYTPILNGIEITLPADVAAPTQPNTSSPTPTPTQSPQPTPLDPLVTPTSNPTMSMINPIFLPQMPIQAPYSNPNIQVSSLPPTLTTSNMPSTNVPTVLATISPVSLTNTPSTPIGTMTMSPIFIVVPTTSSPTTTRPITTTSTNAPIAITVSTPVSATISPVALIDKPIVATNAPVTATETPVVSTNTPVVTTNPPVVDTRAPVVATKIPVVGTNAPVVTTNPTVVDTRAPIVSPKFPVAATNAPIDKIAPVVNTNTPIAVVTKVPVTPKKSPVTATKAPVTTTKAPVIATNAPSIATRTPVAATTTAPIITMNTKPVLVTTPFVTPPVKPPIRGSYTIRIDAGNPKNNYIDPQTKNVYLKDQYYNTTTGSSYATEGACNAGVLFCSYRFEPLWDAVNKRHFDIIFDNNPTSKFNQYKVDIFALGGKMKPVKLVTWNVATKDEMLTLEFIGVPTFSGNVQKAIISAIVIEST